MGKKEKKPPDPPPGVPLWMATFSDLVTLLLTFFVMLLSMASFDDHTKIAVVIQSLQTAMSSGFDPGLQGAAERKFKSTSESLAEIGLNPELAKLAAAFRRMLSDEPASINQRSNSLVVDIPEGAFFRSGESDVHPGAFDMVAQLGDLLAEEQSVRIDVIGYASPTETKEPVELATDRAISVVQRLRSKVKGERITTSPFGSGAFDPKMNQDGYERRIRFVLSSQSKSNRGSLESLDSREGSNAGER